MTDIPKPGQPVRGSQSGSPIMALFDLLGRRWSMGIIWQLEEQGPLTFRGLQSACETVSPAVLNARLKELQTAGFVEKSDSGYQLTPFGREIYAGLLPLSQVSKDWARNLAQ